MMRKYIFEARSKSGEEEGGGFFIIYHFFFFWRAKAKNIE